LWEKGKTESSPLALEKLRELEKQEQERPVATGLSGVGNGYRVT